jgi:micrococcal nuclease
MLYFYSAIVLRVIDGDTVIADIDLGFSTIRRTPIRLEGINTPELKSRIPEEKARAAAAKARLAELLPVGKTCYVRSTAYDKYGRVLGFVYPEMEDHQGVGSVADVLLAEGHAVPMGK